MIVRKRARRGISLCLLLLVMYFIVFGVNTSIIPVAYADGNSHTALGTNPPAEGGVGVGNYAWMCNPNPKDMNWLGECANMQPTSQGHGAGDGKGFNGAYTSDVGGGYGRYQCVWYAWNRLAMIHGVGGWSPVRGDGGQIWNNAAATPGWTVTNDNPEAGMGISSTSAQNATFAYTTHVGVVEKVNPDKSIVISEGNFCARGLNGVWQGYHTRTLTKAQWIGVHFFKFSSWKNVANGTDSGSQGSDSSKKSDSNDKNKIKDEKDLVGMSSPKRLESNQNFPDVPDKSDLSDSDKKTLASLQENDEYLKRSSLQEFLYVIAIILGIVIIIYGTIVLWLAYAFDRSDTFFNGKALPAISMGHYKIKDVNNNTSHKSGSGVRYLGLGGVCVISIMCIAIGYLLTSGKFVGLVSDLVFYLQHL